MQTPKAGIELATFLLTTVPSCCPKADQSILKCSLSEVVTVNQANQQKPQHTSTCETVLNEGVCDTAAVRGADLGNAGDVGADVGSRFGSTC